MDDEGSVVGFAPPPRKSDVLFGAGANWQANACVKGIDARRPIKMDIAAPPSIWRSLFVNRGEVRTSSFIQSSIYTATTSNLR